MKRTRISEYDMKEKQKIVKFKLSDSCRTCERNERQEKRICQ